MADKEQHQDDPVQSQAEPHRDADAPRGVNEAPEAKFVDEEHGPIDKLPAINDDVVETIGSERIAKIEITAPKAPSRQRDDVSDADAIVDDAEESAESQEVAFEHDWDNELSVSRIAVELKRIEKSVRTLLEARDPKRKRKLAGSHRWLELEEDVRNLKYSGRVDEENIRTLERLIRKRHHLFRRLKFLAATRPTWNT